MLIAVLASGSSDADAQTLSLEYEQVVARAVPDATAAFALDPSIVGASAHDGTVTLVGRAPGTTNVVVIAGDHTMSLVVAVGEPPVTVLPGFRRDGSEAASSGYYEARYGSDPALVQGNLLLSRREGMRSAELRLGGATPLERGQSAPLSIPVASFTLREPGRELTLLDRVVSNSPMTLSQANLRGLYVQEGPWRAAAGYSFFSTFEHLLLPTDRQAVAGISYRSRLGPRSGLTPSLYYFGGAASGSRPGGVATLLYDVHPTPGVTLGAEIAGGRKAGGAFDFELDRPGVRGWARLRLAPRALPSLPTDQQSGRQVEGGLVSTTGKTTLNGSVSSRRYEFAAFNRSSTVANLDLQRQLTAAWSVHGGSGVARFDERVSASGAIESVTLPFGISYSRRNGGGAMDYQFSRETSRDLGGHLFRATVNGSGHGFRLSVFGERQTQAPTVGRIFTDAPWLQPLLDRLSLTADTPQQLADLLRTNAELSAYGYATNVNLDVTPVRLRTGATGGWVGSGSRRPQLSISTLFTRDQAIAGTSISAVHTLGYSQRLDRATELFVSWSGLCRGGVVSASACHPVMFASLRRTLDNGPGLLRSRRGTIDGIVFKDDEGRGVYTQGLPVLADVEIVLDEARYTRTDVSGHFRFDDVERGRHRVEARYAPGEPTFFTTPSPVDVATGTSVVFGIAPSRSSLRGVVRTDAGAALSDVVIQIAGNNRRISVRTGDDGTFAAEGLEAGDYDVSVEAGSIPAGYPVESLAPQHIHVEQERPGRVTFVLRPYRSIAGRARVFNRETGKYEVLSGAVLELDPLKRSSITDGNGRFVFRDLPAGTYAVVARLDGQEQRSAVTLAEGPTIVRDIDVALMPPPDVTAGARVASLTRAAIAGKGSVERADARPLSVEPNAAPRPSAFTIEVSAAPNARYVHAMVEELRGAGHAAYVVDRQAPGGNGVYHVRVGTYATRAEADRSARSLERSLGWRMSVMAVTPGITSPRSATAYVR